MTHPMGSAVQAGNQLEIQDVVLAFGGNEVLSGVSFGVPRGSVFGIVGPNGAGKTSLLNCINGFYHPKRGSIAFEGQPITGLRPAAIARKGIARTFQNVELFREASALDNIMLGRDLHMRTNIFSAALYWGPARREEIANRLAAERVIEFLEIEAFRKRPVATLSWGQQKLVEIGRALATEPRMLLLDEPTSGMNREEKEDVARFIMRMKHEMGMTQVLIEHDIRFVSDLCDHIVVLDFGELIASGSPHDVWTDPRVIEAYVGDMSSTP
ncbi:MAG: branched-chain amino acid transport system ATP-binding protein [Acidobacteriota bacterium]|nr:branched-chain amino acid transport system ATP-binding protein [Acidobacteriota bacterium]